VYLSFKIYVIIVGIVILISGVLLFIYRKTRTGNKILEILKKIAIWKIRLAKKVTTFLFRGIKSLFQLLIKLLKKRPLPEEKI
jgi:hypothetical protein